MTDRLHGRGAHLLALAAARGGLGLGLLTVVLPETRIHIALNIGSVLQNVANNSFLKRPPEEVQLTHSGLLNLGLSVNLERNPLTAAERVKQTLAVGLQLTLVLEVNNELLAVQEVGHIELLGVVGDEPLYHAETNRCATRQKWQNLLNTSRVIVEVLEPFDDEVLLALNAALERLTRRIHSCSVRYFVGV